MSVVFYGYKWIFSIIWHLARSYHTHLQSVHRIRDMFIRRKKVFIKNHKASGWSHITLDKVMFLKYFCGFSNRTLNVIERTICTFFTWSGVIGGKIIVDRKFGRKNQLLRARWKNNRKHFGKHLFSMSFRCFFLFLSAFLKCLFLEVSLGFFCFFFVCVCVCLYVCAGVYNMMVTVSLSVCIYLCGK